MGENTSKGKSKITEVNKKVVLGRPGNTLQMGIVGLPNVGKSSTFNLLSKLQVPAENKLFCTIDPNIASVEVPDPRFDKLCDMYKPKSKVKAKLKIIDIAGLVKGASENVGMGNAFLSNISAADGIFHVVRVFDDEEVAHFEGDIDPVRDLDIISSELRIKDQATAAKNYENIKKVLVKNTAKENLIEKDVAEKCIELLANEKNIRDGSWNDNEIEVLNRYQLLTSKPIIYLLNMTETEYVEKKSKWTKDIVTWIKSHGGEKILAYSVAFEKKNLWIWKMMKEQSIVKRLELKALLIKLSAKDISVLS